LLNHWAKSITTYADLPLGAVDASVIAVAERLGAGTVLTIDRRTFRSCGHDTLRHLLFDPDTGTGIQALPECLE
jgi:predicted nucleic acid-binding protein